VVGHRSRPYPGVQHNRLYSRGVAAAVSRMPGAAIALPGFGASDCWCVAHQWWVAVTPPPRYYGALGACKWRRTA
jgi:hypothetical protein